MLASDFRRAARERLKNNWTTAVLLYLLYGICVGVLGLTGIGACLLAGVFSVGLSYALLTLSRTGRGRVEDLFRGFTVGTGSNIVASLLVSLYTALWTLLFIIPGIVKSYSYAMTYYILADHPEMSASDAITASRNMMRGNKWRLFCLDFSFIGWILVSALLCGIPVLWVAPYQYMARAQFYESIKTPATPSFEFPQF